MILLNKIIGMYSGEIKKIIKRGADDVLNSLTVVMDKKMNVFDVDILELRLEDVVKEFGEPDSICGCIKVEIFGKSEIKKSRLGHYLLLADENSVKRIMHLIKDKESEDVKDYIDFFREIGNITSGSFLRSISEYFKFEFFESLPDFCFDMVGSCVDSDLCSVAASAEKTLIFKVVLTTPEKDIKIKIFLLFYPEIYDLMEFKKEIE